MTALSAVERQRACRRRARLGLMRATIEVDAFAAIDRLVSDGLLTEADYYRDADVSKAIEVFVGRILRNSK
jgi:hypothetical protein